MVLNKWKIKQERDKMHDWTYYSYIWSYRCNLIFRKTLRTIIAQFGFEKMSAI